MHSGAASDTKARGAKRERAIASREEIMKNRFFHQYCYGFGRGLAVLAIGVVGVSALLPAVGAHAQ
ncbi:hypothetical protein SB751_33315, partial [Cupriavidus sp. SIMBA_020]|uniref:hypothetical protein n=1 Tax=Cupriavidus sp. SIMBA_020 TaxID=3085766 RepID=UPI00397CBF2E